jgi:DNA-binding NarL/FixJ family response regulator
MRAGSDCRRRVSRRGSSVNDGPHHARPTVLLVDDYLPVLSAVRRVLEPAFNVVDAITDGRLAVDAVRRLDPDVIVLDVAMPGIGGFEIIRDLKRLGSRAPVVFLTMHGEEEYLVTAVESGALGYVVKSRISSDLPRALDHALAQRLCLPSLSSLVAAGRGREHAIHFHANQSPHLDELSRSIAKALNRGDPVAVVATAATRAGIEQRLTGLGVDVARSTAQRLYMVADVADAVAQVMRGGQIDRELLASLVEDLEQARLAVARGPDSRMTIFGEMAVLLRESGQAEAALSLEILWDALTASHKFLTVCMYPVDRSSSDPCERLQGVCQQHSAATYDASL